MHLSAGHVSADEKKRAAAMVAALLRTATRHVKAKRAQALSAPKAKFHKRMAQALYFYQMRKVPPQPVFFDPVHSSR